MKKKALSGSYRIADLIHKHLNGNITPGESRQLEQWLQEKEDHRELFRQLTEKDHISMAMERLQQIESEKADILRRITDRISLSPTRIIPLPRYRNWRYIVAACLLLGIAVVALRYLNGGNVQKRNGGEAVTGDNSNDVLPGGNKATLTLANGAVIVLDSARNGALALQGNTKVIKLNNGQLAYKGSTGKGEMHYNTITTPRGGQYEVWLPDGSKAWLNAASSLRFPTAFAPGERKVELTGEAYFEIAPLYARGKKKKVPFWVDIRKNKTSRVEVLGTHFNIMAYDDEQAVKITLLEGAVEVTEGDTGVRLAPDQQAQLNGQDLPRVTTDVDIAEVMAWKNGMFQFHNADLQLVLRQLSRWYDVDIEYRGTIPSREFEGEMQRNLRLSQVLNLLAKNQVHISIEGKKIVVMP